jgi:ribosomal protein L35
VTLRYRGREITHQDIGMRLLERIRDELSDVSVVEHMPKLEGRQMVMVLAPKRSRSKDTEHAAGRRPALTSGRRLARRRDLPAAPDGSNQRRKSHAQDEDEEERREAVPGAPGGTVKRGQAFKRHILTKKSTKNKRHLRGPVTVHETNMGHMAQMLPFAGL